MFGDSSWGWGRGRGVRPEPPPSLCVGIDCRGIRCWRAQQYVLQCLDELKTEPNAESRG